MHTLTLYRHPLSGHCHRVECFVRMLGLPLKLVDVDLLAAEQRQPAFLAMNRFGQVPVIEHEGAFIADSNAILTYLALRFAPPHWLPREPLAAARVQQWLSVAAGPLASGPATARVIQVFKQTRDPAAAIQQSTLLFERMQASLATLPQAWIAGTEAPSIADLALYAYTAHAPEGHVDLAPYPALRAWLARVEALPGFVPMQRTPVGLQQVAA